jgi:hypothetical protein
MKRFFPTGVVGRVAVIRGCSGLPLSKTFKVTGALRRKATQTVTAFGVTCLKIGPARIRGIWAKRVLSLVQLKGALSDASGTPANELMRLMLPHRAIPSGVEVDTGSGVVTLG